ncbi:MAG: PaaI family thioesterase [Acidobacteriales bacterium]|nr:PaaI family thioesterase [Terriglobales bacterium]
MPKRHSAHGHGTKAIAMPINRCFACGKDNPDGMHLKFYFDEKRRRAFSRFRLPRRYQGPPGHAHGGIIATILDEAMGKVNKLRSVVALTSEMEIQYLKPVPLRQTLIAEGREKSVRGRRHVNVGEIRNQKNEVLARGRAVFIAVDAKKMFARYA